MVGLVCGEGVCTVNIHGKFIQDLTDDDINETENDTKVDAVCI